MKKSFFCLTGMFLLISTHAVASDCEGEYNVDIAGLHGILRVQDSDRMLPVLNNTEVKRQALQTSVDFILHSQVSTPLIKDASCVQYRDIVRKGRKIKGYYGFTFKLAYAGRIQSVSARVY